MREGFCDVAGDELVVVGPVHPAIASTATIRTVTNINGFFISSHLNCERASLNLVFLSYVD
ncbi:MAG: hypothetical protein ACXV4C_08300 [Halobacteriota archaeon]